MTRQAHANPSARFLGIPRYTNPDMDEPYRWHSYGRTLELVDALGSGLDHLFLTHQIASGPVGILSKPRAEWLITEFALYRGSRQMVGLHDSLCHDQLEAMLDQTQAAVVVCTLDHVPALLALKSHGLEALRAVVTMDGLSSLSTNPLVTAAMAGRTASRTRALRRQASAMDVLVIDMGGVVAAGRTQPTAPQKPGPTSLCTGGEERLAHGMLVGGAQRLAAGLELQGTMLAAESLASHTERTLVYAGMLSHMAVGFSLQGNPLDILEDCRALQPTVVSVGGRALEQLSAKVVEAAASSKGLQGALARTAMRRRLKSEAGGLWSKLGGNMQGLLGGRLRVLATRGQICDQKALRFLAATLGCQAVDLYGRGICLDGRPLPGVELSLRDRPELGCVRQRNQCGELMVKLDNSNILMPTGDLVQQMSEDQVRVRVRVLGREENAVCLVTGIPPVCPEYLEHVYRGHPLVQDIFIHCRPDYPRPVAVVVPHAPVFVPLARRIASQPSAPLAELTANLAVLEALLLVLHHHARKAGLRPCELVAEVWCDPCPFDVEHNGLLTAEGKLSRGLLLMHYRLQVERMLVGMESPLSTPTSASF